METLLPIIVQVVTGIIGGQAVGAALKQAAMGQLAKPAQLARLITYMLSPHSGVMTGSLVDYDQNVAGVVGE